MQLGVRMVHIINCATDNKHRQQNFLTHHVLNRQLPKFILTKDGTLRLGMVKRHLELLRGGDRCIGGGYYELDTLSHRLLLSGASSEYGEPGWDKLDRIKISQYYQGFEIIYSSWDNWKY